MSDIATRLKSQKVDPPHRALRVSLRPIDHDGGGLYRSGPVTGLLTLAGANTPVFSMRWTNAEYVALILFVNWWWIITTGFTATQSLQHALYKATGFSASDSGGGAFAANKKRTSGAASKFAAADMRIATTGALTAGTRTKDPAPQIQRGAITGTAAGQPFPQGVAWTDYRLDHEGPLVLEQNEGLVIDNVVAMGAAGVINLFVEVAWAEVPIAGFGGGE